MIRILEGLAVCGGFVALPAVAARWRRGRGGSDVDKVSTSELRSVWVRGIGVGIAGVGAAYPVWRGFQLLVARAWLGGASWKLKT